MLGLAKNLCDQLFFPLEHIAWAADKKLLNIASAPWWVMSIAAWALSLTLSILRLVGGSQYAVGQYYVLTCKSFGTTHAAL